MRHIGYVHAHDPNFNVVCGIEGCSRNYDNFQSYKRHLYRYVFNLEGNESGAGGSPDVSDLDLDGVDETATTASIKPVAAQTSARECKRRCLY